MSWILVYALETKDPYHESEFLLLTSDKYTEQFRLPKKYQSLKLCKFGAQLIKLSLQVFKNKESEL